MKRTFFKMLPLVAAVLLATSCSKDSNDDSNVAIDNPVETQNVASPDNDGVTIVPLTITVNKDGNSLSKATVEVKTGEGGTTLYTQKFVTGDVLVISNSSVLKEDAIFTLKSVNEDKTTATFEGNLLLNDNVTLVKEETKLNAVLKTKGEGDDEWKNDGTGVGVDADGNPNVGTAETLAEAFEKYGCLTADNFTYNGNETQITLTQNTSFVQVNLPFHGAKVTFSKGEKETVKYLYGNEILAIPNGTTITSTLLGINTTTGKVSEDGKKKTVVYNIKSTTAKPRTTPVNCIAGVFSVSADKQIFFSQGNLQYNTKSSEGGERWRFAGNQYDYVGGTVDNNHVGNVKEGESNCTNDNLDGPWIDLFGWGAWVSGQSPTESAQDNSKYLSTVSSGSIPEENNKITVGGTEWRVLTDAEWSYLLGLGDGDSRDKATDLRGWKEVNGVCGLVILPDGSSYNIGSESWETLESAGAVFLPAAGCRDVASVITAGSYGYYWSSSASSANNAWRVVFYSKSVYPYNSDRYGGRSVRLVRSL